MGVELRSVNRCLLNGDTDGHCPSKASIHPPIHSFTRPCTVHPLTHSADIKHLLKDGQVPISGFVTLSRADFHSD